jgi:6-phosphogluconolactonase
MTFFKVLAVIGVISMTISASHAGDQYWVYFGCYTGPKPVDSKGISRSAFNAKTGQLSKPETIAELTNPSFLAIHPNLKSLYAVGEVGEDDKKTQGVNAFSRDPVSGSLKKLNGLSSGGGGPCHVSVSPDGKTAVVANYGGGSCAFYRVAADGSLEKQLAFFQHKGDLGPNSQRQDKTHGHCGKFDPQGRFAYVCDLGLDVVKIYSVGEMVKESGEIKLTPGSGPRHISVAPQGDLAFVNGELDATVNVVSLADKKVMQSISTLPEGKNIPGNTTAEVVFHPNGKFVYCSNRGHNSIAGFTWDGSKLTANGHATKGIKVPRNFNIDPTGQWMLVANQDGNDILVFKIETDGKLTPTDQRIEVGKPVCVVFAAIGE